MMTGKRFRIFVRGAPYILEVEDLDDYNSITSLLRGSQIRLDYDFFLKCINSFRKMDSDFCVSMPDNQGFNKRNSGGMPHWPIRVEQITFRGPSDAFKLEPLNLTLFAFIENGRDYIELRCKDLVFEEIENERK